MKDTGIKWIGLIPDNWQLKKVKNCFYISKEQANDKNPTVLSLARSGIKVRDISTNEGQLAASYENYNPVQPGDLLLNPMDLYSGANCNMSEVHGVISPAYVNLRAKTDLNHKFFDYYFKTQYWAMAMFAHGKGVSFDNRWTMNADTILNYYMPFPQKSVQTLIANYLNLKNSEIEKMLEVENKQIEYLKEYKIAVITEAITKGVARNKTKPSGIEWIGDIPTNWKIMKFKNFTTLISKGATPTRMSLVKDDEFPIRFFKGENIQDGKLIIETSQFIDANADEELKRSRLMNDDLLYVIAGSIGKCAIVEKLDGPANINQAICFSRLKEEYKAYKFFLRYYLSSNLSIYYAQMKSVKTSLSNLSMEDLGNMPVAFPPSIQELHELVKYLDEKIKEIDKLIEIKKTKAKVLENYRQSLFFECVTGKKEVVA